MCWGVEGECALRVLRGCALEVLREMCEYLLVCAGGIEGDLSIGGVERDV